MTAVNAGLLRSCRSAYTTVQTVLNRLSDRGLLRRERSGVAFTALPGAAQTAAPGGVIVQEQQGLAPAGPGDTR